MRYSIRPILLFITAFFLISSVPAVSQNVSRQKVRMTQIEKDIAILDKQIAGIRSQSSSAIEQLELLRKNIENRKSLVSESDKLIKAYSDSIKLKDMEIKDLQAEVDTLLAHYGKLVKAAYKHRDPHVWYLYILASDNVGQAFRRAGYFRNISRQIREDAAVIRDKQSELEQQKTALDDLKNEALVVREGRVKELDDLRKDEREAERIVQQMKKDRKKIEKQIAAKRKEMEALNREIQKMIAEAQGGKDKSSGKSSDNSQDIALSKEFGNNKGLLPWPVNGAVVGGFGKRYHPLHKNLELPPSRGIDVAVDNGEDVKCIFDGVVHSVRIFPIYGSCVLVQHGPDYMTFYCNLDSISVKSGDKVKTGQKIGVADSQNGVSKVHFEIWENRIPLDPVKWLRK